LSTTRNDKRAIPNAEGRDRCDLKEDDERVEEEIGEYREMKLTISE
jgi:hypothetical protein